jgi:hypothetical protein
MYLNKWTPDFSPENDIPSTVPVWVRLSFLPLHCWNDETLRNIGNSLGKYIDRVEPREGIQACARLCVEVDLEKGLPEAIQLTLDNWSYVQQVDYEKIPFKCKSCHEYGHFTKSCPQTKESQEQDLKQDQWQQPKRKKTVGKTTMIPPQGQGEKTTGSRERPPSSPQKGESSHNRYVIIPIEDSMEDPRERQEENGRKRQEEIEEEIRKGKEK